MAVGAAAGCGTRRSVISLAAPRAFNRYRLIDAITNIQPRRSDGAERAGRGAWPGDGWPTGPAPIKGYRICH